MSTNLKSETARINGAKSHGPKTAEGKAKSSQNALRHGLTANSPTLPTESEDDFQTLLDAYLDRYHPADAIETELVQTLAITRWRLRRVGMIESCMLENEMEQSRRHLSWLFEELGDENRVAFAFRNLANDGRALDLLIRYEASLTRAYDRAAKQLDLLQNRKLRNEPTEPVTHPSEPTLREPWPPVGPDPTRAIPVVIKCTPPEVQDHSLRSPKPQTDPTGPYYEKAAEAAPPEAQDPYYSQRNTFAESAVQITKTTISAARSPR